MRRRTSGRPRPVDDALRGGLTVERMSGSDAVLWHMEDDVTPLHTLKVVVLDTSRRGRPVALDDVALAVGSPPRPGAPVDAEGRGPARLRRPARSGSTTPTSTCAATSTSAPCRRPATPRQLDALYGELATGVLPRDRSPWAMTLVHGLEGGRQAVVVRVHHAHRRRARCANTFLAATTDEPGDIVELAPPRPRRRVSRDAGSLRAALVDTLRTWRGLVGLRPPAAAGGTPRAPSVTPTFRRSTRAPAELAERRQRRRPHLRHRQPRPRHDAEHRQGERHDGQRRPPRGGRRRAAGRARRAGRGRLGVVHRGLRHRLGPHRERPAAGQLRHADVRAAAHDLAEPLDRLEATARSCRAGVEARKLAGLDLTDR